MPELQTEAQCRQYIAQIIDFVHGTGVYASELAGVGLAAPGIVVNGIPQLTPNVKADWPTLLNVIRNEFEGTPFECINDANAAALGEMWRGAASGAQSAMLVTIGAGIGAGIVADSIPEREYQEILQKSKALFEVVEEVENDAVDLR